MRLRISQNLLAVLHDALMASASLVLALFLRLGDRTFSYTQGFLLEGCVASRSCCSSPCSITAPTAMCGASPR